MNLAQKILRFMHPEDEKERVQLRRVMSRAQAEAEDVTRIVEQTAHLDGEALRKWLTDNCVGCEKYTE